MGLPLLLLTVALLAGSGVIALFAFVSGRLDVLARVVKVCLVWTAAYFSLLIGASVSSESVVLEPGHRKTFCGAFLDCHLGVSVIRTWEAPTFESSDSKWVADGEFLFVEIEVTSDAAQANQHLNKPRIDLVSADGRRFDRARHLEYELASQLGEPHSLQTILGPQASIRKTLVYSIPADADGGSLKLQATNGDSLERFVELFLIGDEDSLFHRPVLLDLTRTESKKV